MKPTLIFAAAIFMVVFTSLPVFASDDDDDKARKDSTSENSENPDLIEIDSIAINDLIEQGGEGRNPEQFKPAPKQEQSQPEQPQREKESEENNSSISSFNFLYYLIDKFKFPDLIDSDSY